MNQANLQERMRLYLIRHGEVAGAGAGKLLGRTDASLSERGLEQSHRLAKRLSGAQLSAIYSSDLQRALVTAEIIANEHRLKVQQSPAWREIDMGDWEGRTLAALHEESPGLIAELIDDPASFAYPDGESFATFMERLQSALDHLLMKHGADEIALVAHGGVCRVLLGNALGMPAKNWLRLAQDYGCLNVIDWYEHQPIVRLLNEIGSFECGGLAPL